MSLSKTARKRKFREEWEEEFFFCSEGENVKCLLCSKILGGVYITNIKRHYRTYHKEHTKITGTAIQIIFNDIITMLITKYCIVNFL